MKEGGKSGKAGKSSKADKKETVGKERKKEGKSDKGRKGFKNKKRKGREQDTKQKRKSNKRNKMREAGAKEVLVNRPSFISEGMDVKDSEPLFLQDYHERVYRQAWKEWNARGAVAWTLGNGNIGVAAVIEELLLLGLALNTTHAAVATYGIECALANALQAETKGNRLFDPVLKRKVARAFSGKDDGDSAEDCVDEKPPRKKKKSKAKAKKEKEEQNDDGTPSEKKKKVEQASEDGDTDDKSEDETIVSDESSSSMNGSSGS